jgi:hypothetical protein
MTNRTLQFLGLAYGSSNVTITATIDNVTVFNNTVSTLNQELDNPQTITKPMPVLFSVENSDQFPVEFAGSKTMNITVTGGDCILLDDVLCNYQAHSTNVGNIYTFFTGTATDFVPCYNGNPINSEQTGDVRSSVSIDGVVQVPDICPKSQGTWTWIVQAGNTITYNLNVTAGNTGS